MKAISTIIFLGARVVLASLIGLTLQIVMLVKVPDHLLTIQEAMKSSAAKVFEIINFESQYQVAYNLIGGDNVIVHTFFVLIAYLGILILIQPFKSSKPAYKKHKRIFG